MEAAAAAAAVVADSQGDDGSMPHGHFKAEVNVGMFKHKARRAVRRDRCLDANTEGRGSMQRRTVPGRASAATRPSSSAS
jgi:hypothetical protein